jgi:protein-S-isoprenylcysteine O-methyltransferase Ste14
MSHKQITSIVIYFFFAVALYAVIGIVISEYKTGTVCPKVFNLPVCYIILVFFLIALFSHITSKASYLYFIFLGIIFIITLIASLLHLTGNFTCPQTVLKRIPKCYYALGLVSGLLILKYLQFKEIEKGPE